MGMMPLGRARSAVPSGRRDRFPAASSHSRSPSLLIAWLLAALILAPAGARAESTAPPVFSMQFGQGIGNGELTFPWGLAVDSQGNVWVASILSGRVQEFDKEGRYVTQLASEGSPEGRLNAPMGLSVGSNGKVWVVDDASLWTAGLPGSRVEQFSAQGKYEGQLGALGSGEGQLSCPDGVAVDPKGHVWVADYCKGIVEEFSEDGRYIGHIGSQGTADGQFERPQWVAIAPNGNIWVSDSSSYRVQEFKEEEGTSGQYGFVTRFGVKRHGRRPV